MLYYLTQEILKASHGTSWEGYVSFLNVFRYITFRSAGAAVTALLLSLWLLILVTMLILLILLI